MGLAIFYFFNCYYFVLMKSLMAYSMGFFNKKKKPNKIYNAQYLNYLFPIKDGALYFLSKRLPVAHLHAWTIFSLLTQRITHHFQTDPAKKICVKLGATIKTNLFWPDEVLPLARQPMAIFHQAKTNYHHQCIIMIMCVSVCELFKKLRFPH